ncbi:MAG: TetR family transcriptional regulator [Thermoleophilia bacterium]|nr:TetR family transcriptional regulator [Thermoleophilia bacterium]
MRTVDPIKHAARRGEILDAAAACFAARGFDGARTADIAAAAGTSTGNLFHYFAGKRELIVALIDRELDETASYLSDLEARDDPLAALLELLDVVVALAADANAAALALELSAAAHRDAVLAELVSRNDRELRRGIERLVRRAQDAGAIPDRLEPALAATWIAALLDGLFARVAVDPDFAPATQAATLRGIVERLLGA